MPIIQINMIEGRSVEDKRALAKNMTDTICSTLDGVTPDRVRIIMNDMPKDSYSIAGELIIDKT